MARGIPSARGLTDQDLAGPEWLIVATRADGSRMVLAESRRVARAVRLRDTFAAHLEDVISVDVEHIGDTLDLTVQNSALNPEDPQ